MLPLLLPLIIRFGAQAPKTFKQLELAKIVAFHELKSVHLEEMLTTENGGAATPGGASRTSIFQEGNRVHWLFSAPDGTRVEALDDGLTTWLIFHHRKEYWVMSDNKLPAFKAEQKLIEAPPGQFKFNPMGTGPFQFASNPPPEIESIASAVLDGETLRKVVASVTSAKGNRLTVTQYFVPDRWVAKRAEVTIVGPSTNVRMSARLTTLDFHPAFTHGEFQFDPSKVKGYERHEGLPPAGFGVG
jgi:hypothetical protein